VVLDRATLRLSYMVVLVSPYKNISAPQLLENAVIIDYRNARHGLHSAGLNPETSSTESYVGIIMDGLRAQAARVGHGLIFLTGKWHLRAHNTFKWNVRASNRSALPSSVTM
jgi:hypothetical protein